MKKLKLSLIVALATSSFTSLGAASLEDSIKNVDISGILRYRYDSYRYSKDGVKDGTSSQKHKYRSLLNLKAGLLDNFEVFGQLNYSSADAGLGSARIEPDTSSLLALRQAYFKYTHPASSTSFIVGRQQLDTIWTDNGVDGLVGTGVKVLNSNIPNLTLAGFAIDSLNVKEQSGDLYGGGNGTAAAPYYKNIYGIAALGQVPTIDFNYQLWLANVDDYFTFYALDLGHDGAINEDLAYDLHFQYLGSRAHSVLETKDLSTIDDGNFFALQGSLEGYGWDLSLGGLYYGNEDSVSLVVLEDVGSAIVPGEEIIYTNGSSLNGSRGKNIFGFVTFGYTFEDLGVRLGADLVYGATTTTRDVSSKVTAANEYNLANRGGKKYEAVARVDYKYSPKLSFSALYSYVNVDAGEYKINNGSNGTATSTQVAAPKQEQNNIRLQALYKF